jgi:hypothetical protein
MSRLKILHLSVTSKNPQKSSEILAELTNGKAMAFRSKSMEGAWVCMWNEATNELIEFLPEGYLMQPTELGANFKKVETPHGYNSTHFQIETDIPVSTIKAVADKHKCHNYFRPRFGGPLYEVWIEDQILVEFVSDEIRNFTTS